MEGFHRHRNDVVMISFPGWDAEYEPAKAKSEWIDLTTFPMLKLVANIW